MDTKNKKGAQRSNIFKSSWFTLVELIVVIVILAILATISFLSFSSQSTYARDSNRLTDMNSISKWLVLFNALADKFPMPDSKADISASWMITWYQWYAWAGLQSVIKLSNWWKDPLDKTTYYTYSINKKQNRFQILWFLEDWNNAAISYSPFHKDEANADPSSYSGRFVYSKGDPVWIFLDWTTKVPVQATDTSLDIVNTLWNHIAILDNKNTYSWTGMTIAQVNPNASCKRIKDLEPTSRDWTYMINPEWWAWFSVYCDMSTNWWGWTRISSVIKDEAERLQWVASFNWSAACEECSWSWPKFAINAPEHFRSFANFRLWNYFWYADIYIWNTNEYTWRTLYVQMANPTYWNIVRGENGTPRSCVIDYIYLR
ncbi:MAG: hypothetical protein ACD_3C00142G0029 [uncultured bacterium (gcode 4)]|uniref:Prepilin-type N-terminal cleavage/methylation domain-containing protein n=1 Tax=uncultured bacterium (gcode 4) TaxID=1234023 RepID=K2FY04_9BACT|nr:MAG: hypothetical protein ACD_3C00142G0029 [uncultured bacterium (gcode 4)]